MNLCMHIIQFSLSNKRLIQFEINVNFIQGLQHTFMELFQHANLNGVVLLVDTLYQGKNITSRSIDISDF